MKTKSALVETKFCGFCAICGKPTTHEHHLIYGSAGRQLSERHGLKIPCCDTCNAGGVHSNAIAGKLSKMLGQVAFEKEYFRKMCGGSNEEARTEFRRVFGSSFL